MLALILSSTIAAQAPNSPGEAALQLCRPVLARKISGDISAVEVKSADSTGHSTTIRGTVTALIGMGEPGPGQASAHHLIRARYDYSCWVRSGRVRKTSVSRVE